MKLINVKPQDLVVRSELTRSGQSKQFEERLEASIATVGLAEPLKVAPLPSGKYLIVDGMMRWRAISAIRVKDRKAFGAIPAYVVEFDRRFEIRFQSDIYQDLLPSQLATLVEHLYAHANITKAEIARYIGITPPTLRNYTGLWRLLQRSRLCARVVELMDAGVIPSSNPFAWLRLTDAGIEVVFNTLSQGAEIDEWINRAIEEARAGRLRPLPTKYIEEITGFLDDEFYREGQHVRELKKDLGQRRAGKLHKQATFDARRARQHLDRVENESKDKVLQVAASALRNYLL